MMVTPSTRRPAPAPAHSCPGGAPGDHRPSALKLLSLSRGLLGNLNPDRLFRRTCLKKGIACDRAGRRRPGVCGPAMPSRDHRASMTPPQAALSGLRVSPGSGPILLFFLNRIIHVQYYISYRLPSGNSQCLSEFIYNYYKILTMFPML